MWSRSTERQYSLITNSQKNLFLCKKLKVFFMWQIQLVRIFVPKYQKRLLRICENSVLLHTHYTQSKINLSNLFLILILPYFSFHGQFLFMIDWESSVLRFGRILFALLLTHRQQSFTFCLIYSSNTFNNGIKYFGTTGSMSISALHSKI